MKKRNAFLSYASPLLKGTQGLIPGVPLPWCERKRRLPVHLSFRIVSELTDVPQDVETKGTSLPVRQQRPHRQTHQATRNG
jgi:hypothetical protein